MSENKEVQKEESLFVQITLTFSLGFYVASVKIPGYDAYVFDDKRNERDDTLEQTRCVQIYNAIRTSCFLKSKVKINDDNLLSCLDSLLPLYAVLVDRTDRFGLMIEKEKIAVYRMTTMQDVMIPDQTNSKKIYEIGEF
jgi:hypothetical protein